MELTFEWDENKPRANLRKHKVSFLEARTVLADPSSLTIDDPLHSWAEPRYVDIGRSSQGRLLVVVYTESESVIRLISCRTATQVERRMYEEGSS